MLIFGAGLTGLIAACHWQAAAIYEAAPEPKQNHRALLRFRNGAVGESIGIPFRPVNVYKGIYHDGKFVPPDIRLANWYSTKVAGGLRDRSIWNVQPSVRYIAPENLYERLIEMVGNRIIWNTPISHASDFAPDTVPIINTLPMDHVASLLDPEHGRAFNRQSIDVERWRVPRSFVHQTVYFPDPEISVYRATITGDLLIVEFICDGRDKGYERDVVSNAFGLKQMDFIDRGSQAYGKIVEIDDDWRKNFILKLTNEHQTYSLGRFATWRNILLDDVLQDINVIKRLIGMSPYDRHVKR